MTRLYCIPNQNQCAPTSKVLRSCQGLSCIQKHPCLDSRSFKNFCAFFVQSKVRFFLRSKVCMSKLSCAFIKTYLHSYSYEVCTKFLWCIHFNTDIIGWFLWWSTLVFVTLFERSASHQKIKPWFFLQLQQCSIFLRAKLCKTKQMVGCDVSCNWVSATFELWTFASELIFTS